MYAAKQLELEHAITSKDSVAMSFQVLNRVQKAFAGKAAKAGFHSVEDMMAYLRERCAFNDLWGRFYEIDYQ